MKVIQLTLEQCGNVDLVAVKTHTHTLPHVIYPYGNVYACSVFVHAFMHMYCVYAGKPEVNAIVILNCSLSHF